MRILLKLSHWIDRLTERLGQVAALLVLLVVVIGFYNPVARYLGKYLGVKLTTNALIELQWYLFSLIFFLSFAYILKHGVNVRVDFLFTNWSPRSKAWVDFVGHLLFLIPFCLVGIYVTVGPVLQSWGQLPDGSWGTWEISPDADGLPRAPIRTMIIVAFGTLLLQGLAEAIKCLAVITGHAQTIGPNSEDEHLIQAPSG